MNRAVFEAHLLDLLLENGLDACKCKYMISPVYEEGKKYTSKGIWSCWMIYIPYNIFCKLFRYLKGF